MLGLGCLVGDFVGEGEDVEEEEAAAVGGSSRIRWDEAWKERSWATSSEASLAALTARVRGMTRRDWANSPMASCSREPWRGKRK